MNNFTVDTARDSNPSPYSDQFAIKSELTALTTLPPHCVNNRVKKLLLLLKSRIPAMRYCTTGYEVLVLYDRLRGIMRPAMRYYETGYEVLYVQYRVLRVS